MVTSSGPMTGMTCRFRRCTNSSAQSSSARLVGAAAMGEEERVRCQLHECRCGEIERKTGSRLEGPAGRRRGVKWVRGRELGGERKRAGLRARGAAGGLLRNATRLHAQQRRGRAGSFKG